MVNFPWGRKNWVPDLKNMSPREIKSFLSNMTPEQLNQLDKQIWYTMSERLKKFVWLKTNKVLNWEPAEIVDTKHKTDQITRFNEAA